VRQARLSDEAANEAKKEDGPIARTVDRWRDQANKLSRIRLIENGEQRGPVIHKPDVTPYNSLQAQCQAPMQEAPAAVGTREAKQMLRKNQAGKCGVCFE